MRRSVWLAVAASVLACNGLLGHRSGTLEAGAPDADVDAPSELPDPHAIFGSRLVVWLDADDPKTIDLEPDASRIAVWSDKSGQGNDATAIYAKVGSLTVQPIGDRSAIAFSGIPSQTGIFQINDRVSLRWGTGDFLIAAIVAYSNIASSDESRGYVSLWQKGIATWPFWGPAFSLNVTGAPLPDGGSAGPESRVWAGVETWTAGFQSGAYSASTGWNDGALHFFAARKSTADQSIYVYTDHFATASSVPVDLAHDLSSLGRPVLIGGYINGECCFGALDGVIAEIVAVSGTTTPSEIDALESYVRKKYSIPL